MPKWYRRCGCTDNKIVPLGHSNVQPRQVIIGRASPLMVGFYPFIIVIDNLKGDTTRRSKIKDDVIGSGRVRDDTVDNGKVKDDIVTGEATDDTAGEGKTKDTEVPSDKIRNDSVGMPSRQPCKVTNVKSR